MFTPRRIVLMAVGLALSAGAYAAYASFLGGYNGLPALPDEFRRVKPPDESFERPPIVTPTDARLRLAFGHHCDEQNWPWKFESLAKGLIFASGDQPGFVDGNAVFSPLSVAVFGKKRGPDGTPEIHTLYADRATVHFDKPVNSISELQAEKRKVVLVELHSDPDLPRNEPRKGTVVVASNRRTTDPGDDVILTTPGPVYYYEDPKPGEAHIVAPAPVEIVDHQNAPPPSTSPCPAACRPSSAPACASTSTATSRPPPPGPPTRTPPPA